MSEWIVPDVGENVGINVGENDAAKGGHWKIRL